MGRHRRPLVGAAPLPIALRVYAPEVQPRRRRKVRTGSDEAYAWPPVLNFDAETAVDPSQRLNFGSFQYCEWHERALVCVQEGLFYADDLPVHDPEGFLTLKAYAEQCLPLVEGRARDLPVDYQVWWGSRREFVDDRLWHAIRDGALIVAYNLPFDLTRLAVAVAPARAYGYLGGFSLTIWNRWDETTGAWVENRFRPRMLYKTIDSKRAFFGFSACQGLTKGERRHWGACLDLRTLVFACTGRALSLRDACEQFRAHVGKGSATRHGVITSDYIDYNRQDVQATVALLERVRAEFDRHPIGLAPTGAYSPASLAKAYLATMSITPPKAKYAQVSDELLGFAMTAFVGGRAEVRIRRAPIPVVLCDFLSMYPTVNTLMGMWRFLIAKDVEVVEATADVQQLLNEVTLNRWFTQQEWRRLAFFAEITADEDVLPVRAPYGADEHTFGIGVNTLSADGGLWFAGPDLVASALLAGKPPRVVRAYRLVPRGTEQHLTSVRLWDTVPITPKSDDFFRKVIEARVDAKRATDLSAEERERLAAFLKVLANSGSYGIYAELNPQDLPANHTCRIRLHGLLPAYSIKTEKPEALGTYCFPPFAALTTAAARLMLALLERMVTDAGGAYAFCDTDSMAIVAQPHRGRVRCPGGPHRLDNGNDAIMALSWAQVRRIVERFRPLNPYDCEKVPGSILKIEDVNYGVDGRQHVLFAFAISAKRYALFTVAADGSTVIVKASEHGLGHLLLPDGDAKP